MCFTQNIGGKLEGFESYEIILNNYEMAKLNIKNRKFTLKRVNKCTRI